MWRSLIPIIIIVASVIYWVNCDSAYEESRPLQCSKVISVGGCEKHGHCGVMLENGNRTQLKLPVPGQEHCWHYGEGEWRWLIFQNPKGAR